MAGGDQLLDARPRDTPDLLLQIKIDSPKVIIRLDNKAVLLQGIISQSSSRTSYVE